MNGLSQAQKIGQVLMIGVPIDDPAAALPDLGTTAVGGVFLAGRSSASSSTIAKGIEQVQKAQTPVSGARLVVSVDQEGGQVQSLDGDDFQTIPDAVQQGQESSSRLRSHTMAWASQLHDAGITLDLAPVADTVPSGTEDQNPPIGKYNRQYGSDPAEVSNSITTVVSAMEGTGLGATAKHFPGLGRVLVNTDTSSHAVDQQTNSGDSYLDPFKAAIAAGVTAVMVSSATYPQLDPDHIAAFSPAVMRLLRGQLHFNGVIVSDDMGSAVAVSDFSPGERAVNFIRAGGDLVLSVDVRDLEPMTSALTRAAADDAAFESRIEDAALHVLSSKKLSC